MDKQLIRERFARAIPTYDRQAVVQRTIAGRMVDLLGDCLPPHAHGRVWEIGCGTGLFTRPYISRYAPGEMELNDLCPEMEPVLADVLGGHVSFAAYDVESRRPAGRFSLIVSCSSLQWLEHPLRFLNRCKAGLTAGGYMAFSLFGEQNFRELKAVSGVSLPYLPLAGWLRVAGVMGYRVVHAHEELLPMTFASPVDVLRHLRHTGVAGIRRSVWTKGQLSDFATAYNNSCSTPDGRVLLTYHPIYIILKNQTNEA